MPLLEFDRAEFPGIFIDNVPLKFYAPTLDALVDLRTNTIGHDLLEIISKRTRGIGISGESRSTDGRFRANTMKAYKCVIRRGPGTTFRKRVRNTMAYRSPLPDVALTNDLSNQSDVAVGDSASARRRVGINLTLPGPGFSAVALIEPDCDYSEALDRLDTPLYVALGHELIHCMHYLSGDINVYSDGTTQTLHEEARTIGLGMYKDSRISENAIRAADQIPRRTYWSTPGDCDRLTPDRIRR